MICKILYPDPILINQLFDNPELALNRLSSRLFFATSPDYADDFYDGESLGVYVDYEGQSIDYKSDTRYHGIIISKYTFRPSNIRIELYQYNINTPTSYRRLYIWWPNSRFQDEIGIPDIEDAEIEALKVFLNNEILNIHTRKFTSALVNIPRAREGMEARKVWNNRVGLPYNSGPGRNFAAEWPRTVNPNRKASKIRNEKNRKTRKNK